METLHGTNQQVLIQRFVQESKGRDVRALVVGDRVVDYIADRAGFPDIDVRQRLAVSTGYGVAEIAVMSGSDMVGRTLEQSGLRDKDIQVLTLHRGTRVVPNPLPGKVLEDAEVAAAG